MRSEKEMLELICGVARSDPRIRAAYLEGSRVNPNVPKDIFQDYDVGYLVSETKSFRDDKGWIDRFGERLYMQYPEENSVFPSDMENCYGWLMQFADGVRLDLHVRTLENVRDNLELYRVLVDKDGLLPKEADLSDERYWVKKPAQEEFSFACNEFWWCLNNVAKGLWRGEIPYVMDVLDFQVRPMLRKLLEWRAGADNSFSVSVGKSAKYLGNFLPEEIYQSYLQTYPAARSGAVWEAVFLMCDLFDQSAAYLSGKLNLFYDSAEAAGSRGYLKHVQTLPKDAKAVYE